MLERLRRVQREWLLEVRDFGLLPENEIHSRARGSTPFEVARDDAAYPLERILQAAELAASRDPQQVDEVVRALGDADSAVRYWGAIGLLVRAERGVAAGREGLRRALDDPAPAVRITAAEALGRYGTGEETASALEVLDRYLEVDESEIFLSLMALAALDAMEERARPLLARIEAVSVDDITRTRPSGTFVLRLKEKILADLDRTGA